MRPEVRERQAHLRDCVRRVAVGNQSFYAALGGKKATSAAWRSCPSTRRRRTSSLSSGRTTRCSGRGARSRRATPREDRRGDLPAGSGHRRRREGRKTSLDDAGITTKLVGFDPTATDLTGPLDRGRRSDGGHRRAPEQRGRLRQRRQDAAAARRAGLEGRLEPALPERQTWRQASAAISLPGSTASRRRSRATRRTRRQCRTTRR